MTLHHWPEDNTRRQAELKRRPYSKLHSVVALRDDDPKYKAVNTRAEFYEAKPRRWPWQLDLVIAGVVTVVVVVLILWAMGGFK